MCRTPLGLPVLPLVYSRKSGSSESTHSTCAANHPALFQNHRGRREDHQVFIMLSNLQRVISPVVV